MPKGPITVEEFNERGITEALQKLIWQAFEEEVTAEIDKLTMVRKVASELVRKPNGGGGGSGF